MAPHSRIVLVRHGQAAHNIANDFELRDPPLTKQGELECQTLLGDKFLSEYPEAKKVELMVISPLYRTLQTASLGFSQYVGDANITKKIYAGIQETSSRPCDTGSDPSILEADFPQFDFSELDPEFRDKKNTIYAPKFLPKRAAQVRKWLYDREESFIVVVCHSGFLRHITPHDFPFVENRDMYRNCEYREFTFTNLDEDEYPSTPHKLVETTWSRDLRAKKRGEIVTVNSLPTGPVIIQTHDKITYQVKEKSVHPAQQIVITNDDIQKIIDVTKQQELPMHKVDDAIIESEKMADNEKFAMSNSENTTKRFLNELHGTSSSRTAVQIVHNKIDSQDDMVEFEHCEDVNDHTTDNDNNNNYASMASLQPLQPIIVIESAL